MGKTGMLNLISENTDVLAEMKVILIFFMVFALVAILGIVVFLYKISNYVAKGHTADELRYDIREVLDETIQEKIRQLSIEHAELYKLRQWVTELNEEELDINTLSEETATRVKALAIKMAEEELERALADRDEIDRERSRCQRKLNDNSGNEEKVDYYQKKMALLTRQYKFVTARIEAAKKRLGELTNIQ